MDDSTESVLQWNNTLHHRSTLDMKHSGRGFSKSFQYLRRPRRLKPPSRLRPSRRLSDLWEHRAHCYIKRPSSRASETSVSWTPTMEVTTENEDENRLTNSSENRIENHLRNIRVDNIAPSRPVMSWEPTITTHTLG